MPYTGSHPLTLRQKIFGTNAAAFTPKRTNSARTRKSSKMKKKMQQGEEEEWWEKRVHRLFSDGSLALSLVYFALREPVPLGKAWNDGYI